jgi:hypothetical protein
MCQLEHLNEIEQKNNWFNDKLQFSIRKYRYYKKLLYQRLHSDNIGKVLQINHNQIQSGDTVVVRSEAEIKNTLNRWRKTRGCTFQIEMYQHCNKEYKVFKKVDYFFDETRQKMCKCNDLFLLEGCYCSGATAYLKPCQRNCFFFWHSSWISRISNDSKSLTNNSFAAMKNS